MFKLELMNLAGLDPCTLDPFHAKAKGAVSIEYPDGWLKSDSLRVAKENPISFLWLVSKQAIPVSFLTANAILDDVYGKDGADAVRQAFRDAGEARSAKAAAAKKSQKKASSLDAPPPGSFLENLMKHRSPEGAKAASSTPSKPSPGSLFETLGDVVRDRKSILGGFLKKTE